MSMPLSERGPSLALSARELNIVQLAFDLACDALHVAAADEAARQQVARAVLDSWRSGARDPNMLIEAACGPRAVGPRAAAA